MLDQDYAEQQIAKLEGWLGSADEIAKDGEDTQEAAERIIGAMTDEEATAFWSLYLEAEDILMSAGHRQLSTSDAELDAAEMRGVAVLVWARTIIDYDIDRGDLAGYLMTASRPHWRRYLRSVSPSSSGDNRRRVARLLRQLRVRMRTHQGRDATLEEKVEYVRDRNYHVRQVSEDALASMIREIEQQKPPASLDTDIHEDGDRTLHDVLPSGPQLSIDTEEVARKVAQKTGREELLDRLLGADVEPTSLSQQKARLIYLEREARGADAEQIAWEHSTSPYLVEQIEEIYDVRVTTQDVDRYKVAQGYAYANGNQSQRKLSAEQVKEICRRYKEEDITYAELADEYPIGTTLIGEVIRGEAYQHVDRPHHQ